MAIIVIGADFVIWWHWYHDYWVMVFVCVGVVSTIKG